MKTVIVVPTIGSRAEGNLRPDLDKLPKGMNLSVADYIENDSKAVCALFHPNTQPHVSFIENVKGKEVFESARHDKRGVVAALDRRTWKGTIEERIDLVIDK